MRICSVGSRSSNCPTTADWACPSRRSSQIFVSSRYTIPFSTPRRDVADPPRCTAGDCPSAPRPNPGGVGVGQVGRAWSVKIRQSHAPQREGLVVTPGSILRAVLSPCSSQASSWLGSVERVYHKSAVCGERATATAGAPAGTVRCQDLALVGGALVAIDGSTCTASPNRKRNGNAETLTRARPELANKITSYLQALEAHARHDPTPPRRTALERQARIEPLRVRQETYQTLRAELAAR